MDETARDLPQSVPADNIEVVSPVKSLGETTEFRTEAHEVEEAVVSDHATTGSETESEVETTLHQKARTYLHQDNKWKTLHLMKNDNRVVYLCGRKASSMYTVTQTPHRFDTPKCRQCFAAKLD